MICRWPRLAVAVGVAAALALVLAVAGSAEVPSGVVHPEREHDQPLVELGSELFAGNCASCHGAMGQGVNPQDAQSGAGDVRGFGPDLRGVGAIAPDFYLRTGRMPLGEPGEVPERAEPDFSDHEIRAMTAYIASLGKGPAIPNPHPRGRSLSSGLHLFTEHCAGCHQVVGEGGYVTDTKVPVLHHASPTQVAEAVRIGPYLMPSFSKQDLSDRELGAIVAYVEASKAPTDAGGFGLGHIGPVPEGMVAWLVAGVVLVGICGVIGSRVRS